MPPPPHLGICLHCHMRYLWSELLLVLCLYACFGMVHIGQLPRGMTVLTVEFTLPTLTSSVLMLKLLQHAPFAASPDGAMSTASGRWDDRRSTSVAHALAYGVNPPVQESVPTFKLPDFTFGVHTGEPQPRREMLSARLLDCTS